jgi:hypothetical protein
MILKKAFSTINKYKFIWLIILVVVFIAGVRTTVALKILNPNPGDNTSLAGWWKLDNNGLDSSGNQLNGTVVGATPTTDEFGNNNYAYSFAGTSGTPNYIAIPSSTLINSGTSYSQKTVAFYFNTTNNSTTQVLWQEGDSSNGLSIYITGGDIDANAWGSYSKSWGPVTLSVPISANTWYYFAAEIYTGGGWEIYINGTTSGSTGLGYGSGKGTSAGSIGSSTNPATIGAVRGTTMIGTSAVNGGTNGTDYFQGSMSQVRTYNTLLTLTQIQDLQGVPRQVVIDAAQKGLIGWWRLNGNLYDSTPYSNNLLSNSSSCASYTTDRMGLSNAAFNSINSSCYLYLSASTTASLPTENYSVSFWENTPITTSQTIFMGAVPNISISISSSGITAGSLSGSATVTDNNWHLITVTVSPSTEIIYVDGVQIASGTPGSYSTGGLNISGFGDSNSSGFVGALSSLRIYNNAIPLSTITNLYQDYSSSIKINSLDAGLVGYWPFNGNASDSTPYSDNGIVSGATLTTDQSGISNRAYLFNGSAHNCIAIPNNSAFSWGTSDFMVTFWLKDTTDSASTPVIYNNDFNVQETGSGQLQFSLPPGYTSTPTNNPNINIADGKWHFVVVGISGTTAYLYVDTYDDGHGSIGSRTNSPGYTFIGDSGTGSSCVTGSNSFTGSITGVRVYNNYNQNLWQQLFTTYQ